jgi:hypothetical protein
MRCEDIAQLLHGQRPTSAAEHAEAAAHLAVCADCRAAQAAIEALQADRDVPIRVPSEGSLHRAVLRAVQLGERSTSRGSRRIFWRGVSVGAAGALAAGLLVAMLLFRPGAQTPSPAAAPRVTLALNEAHMVSVALDSPEPLADAEIHVSLNGAVGLKGFDGQREIRWRTDLARGVNQLTLPLIALGVSGGQVLVEVTHGEKHRTFLIDVRTADDGAKSG